MNFSFNGKSSKNLNHVFGEKVACKCFNFDFIGRLSSENIILKRATDVKKNYYEQITSGIFIRTISAREEARITF